ncbi:cystatin-B-like [Sorex araneus]|uniref:cystatin-B-like n=1 Tax=Sorex araneus TaxID=42254 RepID=UPI0024340AFD|nr:cystatin-B-like [Sorex araneus]
MGGGLTTTQPTSPATQAIADQVRAQLEEKENRKFSTFKAVEYKSQVVAGRSYFIKVRVDEDEFAHLHVFQSLPQENKPLVLANSQMSKARHKELTYF